MLTTTPDLWTRRDLFAPAYRTTVTAARDDDDPGSPTTSWCQALLRPPPQRFASLRDVRFADGTDLDQVASATVHETRLRVPTGQSQHVVQSALLQLLHELAEAEERGALPYHVNTRYLRQRPPTEASVKTAEFSLRAGKGGDTVHFHVRPFHKPTLRQRMPHLTLAPETYRTGDDARGGCTLRSSPDLPGREPVVDLLTLPPECLLFGDRLPACHRDAFPTYTSRSGLWSVGMLLLTLARPGGVSPLLRRRPGPIGSAPPAQAARYAWRYPAPPAFVADVTALLQGGSSRLTALLTPRFAPANVAHYLWGLVELLGWPSSKRQTKNARVILEHSSLFALLKRYRHYLRFAFMCAPDAPGQYLGWLQGIYTPKHVRSLAARVPDNGNNGTGPLAVDPDLEEMREHLKRLRPTFRAMLDWDQWRGRHHAYIVLRRAMGPLVAGPLVTYESGSDCHRRHPAAAASTKKSRRRAGRRATRRQVHLPGDRWKSAARNVAVS